MGNTSFDDFMRDVEDEAVQEGPAAVRHLEFLGQHYGLSAEVLKRRREQGLSKQQVARRAGVRVSDVSRIEGVRSMPSIAIVRAVLYALGARLEVVDLPSDVTQRDLDSRKRSGRRDAAVASSARRSNPRGRSKVTAKKRATSPRRAS